MLSLLTVIGGIGFFLLGMNLMADGLKSIAGDALKQLLNRFTGRTMSSIATGALMTCLAQSSTATTLMTLGFVSAGMLTFLQATGVIFGANLGSTSTGWIVALLGIKFSISSLALPVIGLGVLMRQFRKRKLASLGNVLTGFGLLFIGIQFLQEGMADLNQYIDLGAFAGSSLFARFILILVGIAMTIVMQASSAAVATTITVLVAGTINLEQAVALVIGQNIGTTFTAAIAAIGSTVPAKRTAMAHVLFNVITGIVAYIFFPLLISGLVWSTDRLGWQDPALILALFHTSFSLLGILVLAPMIRQFTKLIEKMLPEKKSAITKHLDQQVILLPAVAIETATRSLKEAALLQLQAMLNKIEAHIPGSSTYGTGEKYDQELQTIDAEMEEVRKFIAQIHTDSPETAVNYISVLHALDHIDRMNRLVRANMNDIVFVGPDGEPYRVVQDLRQTIASAIDTLQQSNLSSIVDELSSFSQQFANFRRQERANTFNITATGEVAIHEAFQYVQLILLIDGIAYHMWRLAFHLSSQEEGGSQYRETVKAHLPSVQI